MKVFSALLAEIKGVFGKAYLLAGLLPALLLVLVVAWFESGLGLRGAIRSLVQKAGEDASDLLALLVLAVVLGLAFFAARAPLVQFAQTLALPGLGPLRNCMVRRQMAKRQRLEAELRRREHEYTVVKWATRGEHDDFSPRSFLPPGSTVPDEGAAVAASSGARTVISDVIAKNDKGARRLWAAGLPTEPEAAKVVDGLGSFYAHATTAHGAPAVQAEIAAWRRFRAEGRVTGVLNALAAGLHGDTIARRTRLEHFPTLDWIRPTALGARAAALEGYAKDRYGIDTSSLLVRLYGVLTDEERSSLSDSRLTIEVLLNLSAAAVAVAAWVLFVNVREVWLAHPLTTLRPHLRTSLFVLVPPPLAVLFYRAAVFAYDGLREKVVRAVDTARLAALKKLGFKPPLDVAEERALWSSLSEFFVDGLPLNPRYELKSE